jgi:serine/threonine-protein kinase HipA
MAKETLNIDIHFDGSWHEAAELLVHDTDAGLKGRTTLTYNNDYIDAQIAAFGTHDARTISEHHPLLFEAWSEATWPPFTLDIMPAGAARRWWSNRLADQNLTDPQLDFVLLRDYTVAPIGHLRITRPSEEAPPPIPFTKDEVCTRSVTFLEYAAERGAAIGGATGAGGDAPKVLLVEDAAGHVYPEAALPDEDVKACWFVKWPRGRDTDRDRLVLRTEYLYSHALAAVGLATCAGNWRELDGGKPSLWLPRFDRVVGESEIKRLAVESFYSLAGVVQSGATVSHLTFLTALAKCVENRGQRDQLAALVKEYICRDLLDVVLGNSDNHGRNRAVLRGAKLELAPIYDLAPMMMDPEGVTRSTRWGDLERGGHIDWQGVCRAVSPWVGFDDMQQHLRDFSERLLTLPDMLRDSGLSDEVFDFPRIYLRRLPEVLKGWGLR